MQPIGIFAGAAILANCIATATTAWAHGRCDTRYSITDLGTLAGQTSAHDINDRGKVVGSSSISAGDPDLFHAFLWSPEHGMEDLGTLGGDVSIASGINKSGQAVGWSGTGPGLFTIHAFLWTQQDGMQDLGAGDSSYAYDVNDPGQVVGSYISVSGESHAFLLSRKGRLRDLGTLGGEVSGAFGINNRGQVVGNSDTPSGETHAFLWTREGGMKDLGTLGGSLSSAEAINSHGWVVGGSFTFDFGPLHAFLWSPQDGMQDLGTLGAEYGYANGINDRGHVVGDSQTSSGAFHPFLWSRKCGMQDLNDLITPGSGIELSGATAINARGQVAANDGGRAYLLTPVPGETSELHADEPGEPESDAKEDMPE
jgi:probable HAF family extracellular repeat protein